MKQPSPDSRARTGSAHPARNPPARILIIKLTSIGDVAHTIPISYALSRHWPEARLDWLVGRKASPLVEFLPWVHSLDTHDLSLDEGLVSLGRKTRTLAAELKRRSYDLAVDFQGLLRSSIWTFLSGAKRRAGRGRWPWLQVSVPMYDTKRTPHAIENTARPLERLGLDMDRFFEDFRQDAAPALAESLLETGRASALRLELRAPFWVWLPQSSWPSKSLPLHRVSSAPEGISHLVIGDGSYRNAPLPRWGRWRNLSGLPLLETAALCLLAERVIGADTGPAQLAALLGAPIAGCFGPTRAERSGLRGARAVNLQGECTGCRRRRCRRAEECLLPAVTKAMEMELH